MANSSVPNTPLTPDAEAEHRAAGTKIFEVLKSFTTPHRRFAAGDRIIPNDLAGDPMTVTDRLYHGWIGDPDAAPAQATAQAEPPAPPPWQPENPTIAVPPIPAARAPGTPPTPTESDPAAETPP